MDTEPVRSEMPGPTPGQWVLVVLFWLLRHWFLVLVAAGLIYGAVHVNESEHPRPGYVPAGEVTRQQCLDQGGEIVDDVCYAP